MAVERAASVSAWRRGVGALLRRGRCALGAMLALAALGAAAWTLPQSPGVLTLESAQALLEPDGLPPWSGTFELRQRWDILYPGRGGRARYRIELPPRSNTDPRALYFSRVGNQALVRVNGVVVQRWGSLGDPGHDAAKNVLMTSVPSSLLLPDRANLLEVDVTIQAQRWGGLSVLRYGAQSDIEALYEADHRWRHSAMVVFAASLLGMGGLVAVLWWRQREPLYGWFSLAAFLGLVRNVDRIWPDVPVPWPLWGAIAAVCYAVHLALICRFTLMALGPVSRRLDIAIDVVVVGSSTLGCLSFLLGIPLLWTLGLAALVPLGVASLAVVVHEALRRGSLTAWALALAGALAVAAGLYDFGAIRLGHSSGLRLPYTQHAIFVFVLIMAGLVAERYSRSVLDFQALNAQLARRVADRERQLQQAFDTLRAQQHEQSVSRERQRIMREIHDGVGSQLVGLLNMVTRPGSDPALKEQVQVALDEMRMAVDSLQPVHDDLVTVLATLRYRLQPRLQDAGVKVVWDVDQLPTLRHLSPNAVLQVQRILLEAFTNVLKHAQATCVTVLARWQANEPPAVTLEIVDDGVGWSQAGTAAPPSAHGRGIDNMRARAEAIGAHLGVESRPEGGVRVTLHWPVEVNGTPAPEPGVPPHADNPTRT